METLRFISQASLADFREVTSVLEWMPVDHLPRDAIQAWQPEGADALLSWYDDDGYVAPILEISGNDAEFIAAELQTIVLLLDAVDIMNAIAQAATHEELAVWAERLGLFARGDHDPALESVIVGLINSEDPRFQLAVLRGLCAAQWPCLADSIRNALQAGRLRADLESTAQAAEERLSSMGTSMER